MISKVFFRTICLKTRIVLACIRKINCLFISSTRQSTVLCTFCNWRMVICDVIKRHPFKIHLCLFTWFVFSMINLLCRFKVTNIEFSQVSNAKTILHFLCLKASKHYGTQSTNLLKEIFVKVNGYSSVF